MVSQPPQTQQKTGSPAAAAAAANAALSRHPSQSGASSSSQSQPAKPLDAKARKALQNARYARMGIKPPPRLDNRRRFRNFIDRINRRQWDSLGDMLARRVTYNGHEVSQYELLQLLRQEFAPKTHVTMDIVAIVGGKSREDEPDAESLEEDEIQGGPVAARLKVKYQVVDGPVFTSSKRKKFEYARHMFMYFNEKNKINEIHDLSDDEEKKRQASAILPLPSLRPPPPRVSIDMGQFYDEYIACINNETTRREELHKFCKPPTIMWNGAKLTAEQYGKLMQNTFDAIEGLEFVAATVLVDESKQLMAVRVEFSGTPVKPYGGAIPTGREVFFSEHAFYWLEQGKISDVLTIVDWEGYKSQLIH